MPEENRCGHTFLTIAAAFCKNPAVIETILNHEKITAKVLNTPNGIGETFLTVAVTNCQNPEVMNVILNHEKITLDLLKAQDRKSRTFLSIFSKQQGAKKAKSLELDFKLKYIKKIAASADVDGCKDIKQGLSSIDHHNRNLAIISSTALAPIAIGLSVGIAMLNKTQDRVFGLNKDACTVVFSVASAFILCAGIFAAVKISNTVKEKKINILYNMVDKELKNTTDSPSSSATDKNPIAPQSTIINSISEESLKELIKETAQYNHK